MKNSLKKASILSLILLLGAFAYTDAVKAECPYAAASRARAEAQVAELRRQGFSCVGYSCTRSSSGSYSSSSSSYSRSYSTARTTRSYSSPSSYRSYSSVSQRNRNARFALR